MQCLLKEEQLILRHEPGKGAWTYHLTIPGTRELKGKWGSLKVSGFIDHYEIRQMNLAPLKGADKRLSINDTIRKAIHKSGGDTVTVTLYLHTPVHKADKTQVLDCFEDAGVAHRFTSLPQEAQAAILADILAQPGDEQQVKRILHHIALLAGERPKAQQV